MSKARIFKNSNSVGITLLIVLLGAVLRLLLAQIRWINPDEGAHLLDAHLFLQGMTPVADFGSRQPLYVAILGLFVKIGGCRLMVGRLMPIAASVGSLILLWRLGRRLFDEGTGTVAAALAAFFPLLLIWSTVVKTEPLTIFFGCLSMLWFVDALKNERPAAALASGGAAAAAFYVRQAAIYLPIAVFLFAVLQRGKVLKAAFVYAAGYVAAVAVTALLFLGSMSWKELALSQLNPAMLIVHRLLMLFDALPASMKIVDESGFRILDQSIDYTLSAWQQALAFCALVVLPPLLLSLSRERLRSRFPEALPLLYCWAGVVAVMYAFQSANRGFYTQYFTEALPPLLLMTAALMARMPSPRRRIIAVAGIPLFFAVAAVSRLFLKTAPAPLLFAAAFAAAAAAARLIIGQKLSFQGAVYWAVGPSLAVSAVAALVRLAGGPGLTALILMYAVTLGFLLFEKQRLTAVGMPPVQYGLLVSFFISALFCGKELGPKYESVWSPRTLRSVTAALNERAESGDQLLSGGSIWTFEAGLQPFLGVSHPTELLMRRRSDFEMVFSARPPQFIVVDGYTERKYVKYWPFIQERLEIDYRRVASFAGSRYPVVLYEHAAGAPQRSMLSAREGGR